MTLDEFQEEALRTAGNREGKEARTYAALSLVGEAGEYSELVKKAEYHGHDIPGERYLLELGDCLWSVAYAAAKHGFTLEQVGQALKAKLRKRYPEGFSPEASRTRLDIDSSEAVHRGQ
jgi:NTP pyrophosphatase (non-canonical NTP hydrolase)